MIIDHLSVSLNSFLDKLISSSFICYWNTNPLKNIHFPFYPQHKSPVSAEYNMGLCPCTVCVRVCTCVCLVLVSVLRWASKANGCHRDEDRELGVEQALRETSPMFVWLLFQYIPFPPLLSSCSNILGVRNDLHASPALSKLLSPIFCFIVLHVA